MPALPGMGCEIRLVHRTPEPPLSHQASGAVAGRGTPVCEGLGTDVLSRDRRAREAPGSCF